jgi:hypothetical protein
MKKSLLVLASVALVSAFVFVACNKPAPEAAPVAEPEAVAVETTEAAPVAPEAAAAPAEAAPVAPEAAPAQAAQ